MYYAIVKISIHLYLTLLCLFKWLILHSNFHNRDCIFLPMGVFVDLCFFFTPNCVLWHWQWSFDNSIIQYYIRGHPHLLELVSYISVVYNISLISKWDPHLCVILWASCCVYLLYVSNIHVGRGLILVNSLLESRYNVWRRGWSIWSGRLGCLTLFKVRTLTLEL